MNIKLHLQLAKEAKDRGDVLFHQAHLNCAAEAMVEDYLNEKGDPNATFIYLTAYATQFDA